MDLYQRELENLTKQNLSWDKLQNKTVMISGATGMIGKCMIDFLMLCNKAGKSSVRIVALSRSEDYARERFAEYWGESEFAYYSCDVNEVIPDYGKADYIIHAASNTHPRQYADDPIGTITANVMGTKNLLDYAVRNHTQRFCFLSSVEIYGENRGDVEKFDENYLGYIDCNTMRAGYPESKRVGETLCNAYGEKEKIEYVIPRLSRVYGPTMRDSDTKAIAQFIKKANAGEDIVLKSAGTQKYSYTYVTDAVNAILWILLMGNSGEAYNVADSNSDITLKDLAELLAKKAGTKVIYEIPEEQEQKGYSKATKAMLETKKLEGLGWKARVHLKGEKI